MVDVSVILAAVLVLVTFPAAGVITGPKEKPPKGLAAVVGAATLPVEVGVAPDRLFGPRMTLFFSTSSLALLNAPVEDSFRSLSVLLPLLVSLSLSLSSRDESCVR